MNRTDIINHVIRTGGYTSYLEIGVRNPDHNFNRIEVQTKWGCDPAVNAEFVSPCKSDVYFSYCELVGITWDVIFVDGDHSYPQCTRDMVNAMRYLNAGGCVILHDTLPRTEQAQVNRKPDNGKTWNGQAWRSVVEARRRGYRLLTVNTDHGVTILQDGDDAREYKVDSWREYQMNRVTLAGIVEPADFLQSFATWLDTEVAQ